MKEINTYIVEKLTLSQKKTYTSIDSLTGDNLVMYSDRWDEDEDTLNMDWEDAQSQLKEIDKDLDCGGYLIIKYKSLGEIQNKKIENNISVLDQCLQSIEKDLETCIDTVITGKDYGYEIRMVGGHLEIDCINSGSCVTYYIYAIEKTAWDHLEAYWEGNDEVNSLAFLYAEGSLVPIEEK